MQTVTCIYCRKAGGKQFPSEHVIPQAFGRFKNNLTLSCVCEDCNKFFGKELEVFLARDSAEALLRIRYGLKTKSGRRRLRRTRLKVRVIEQGDWYGALLEVERDPSSQLLKATPIAQVAFQKNGEKEWTWYLEEELDSSKTDRYRKDAKTKIVGPNDDAVQRLSEKIEKLGIVFKQRGTFEEHRGMVEVFAESTLDEIILRGVGKITFNFLAYARGEEFALRSDFDLFRDFVRWGKKPPWLPVLVSQFPILYGDDARYRQTNGHIVVLDWDKSGQGIVCMLSLFNHLTYHASLCQNYSGIWHPISAGRHFDLATRVVSEVRGL
jgi:hypothetical protein